MGGETFPVRAVAGDVGKRLTLKSYAFVLLVLLRSKAGAREQEQEQDKEDEERLGAATSESP